MKKTFAALTLIAASFTASAETTTITGGKWERTNNSQASSYANNGHGMTLTALSNGRIGIAVIFDNSEECKGLGIKESEKQKVWYFNNQAVNISRFCADNGQLINYPSNPRGDEYVINQFRTKHTVTIGSIRWNAAGFTEQLNMIKNAANAL